MSTTRRTCAGMALALLLAGAWLLGSAGWIHAKAALAQHLIARAWQGTAAGAPARRPWPGADLRPIARLTVPARGVDLFVLDDANPRALAFGPALVAGTAAPGSAGNSVIVAHRDTHFAFLHRVVTGDAIEVDSGGGRHVRYRVSEIAILHKDGARLLDSADSQQLTLITCYPFDAVRAGSEMRYVVIAERVA